MASADSLLLLLQVTTFGLFLLVVCPATSGASTSVFQARRQKNLDHLDAATLTYYMTTAVERPQKKKKKRQQNEADRPLSPPEIDYDLVVLFYASWDSNSHALAPAYDQIGTILKAGTIQSKLIMGLFDCELNKEHVEACNVARIKHYPTVAFFSLAPGGYSLSSRKPRHMVHFNGNWQYTESVLDWIKSMSWLSQWHRAAWGRKLRRMLFFGVFDGAGQRKAAEKAAAAPLPVGVPETSGGGGVSSGIASTTANATIELLETEIKKQESLVNSSYALLDAMLFPVADDADSLVVSTDNSTKNYSDAYAYLNRRTTADWQSFDNNYDLIVKMCVMELALDYCTRLSVRWANDWLQHNAGVKVSETDIAKQLTDEIDAREPYCTIVENCVITDMLDAKCRPESCPFQDKTACRYLTACFTEPIQKEYAVALNIEVPKKSGTSSAKGKKEKHCDKNASDKQSGGKRRGLGGGWGLG